MPSFQTAVLKASGQSSTNSNRAAACVGQAVSVVHCVLGSGDGVQTDTTGRCGYVLQIALTRAEQILVREHIAMIQVNSLCMHF